MRTTPLYLPADFYLIRTPALSSQIFQSLSSHQEKSPTSSSDFDDWLQEQLSTTKRVLLDRCTDPQVELALAVASFSLHEGLARLRSGRDHPTQTNKIFSSMLRYIIRMSTRPTPFGLFSGVALGTFANETHLQLASSAIKKFRTRPDMRWLLDFLRQIEEDQTLVTHLKVRWNQTAYVAGERVVLPFADIYGEQDKRAISLRATPVVRRVFALAQEFISYADLQASLQQVFPSATPTQIQRLLWQLWEHRFLVSQLHPPLTDAQPARYVLEQLKTLPEKDHHTEQMARVLKRAADLDRSGITAPVSTFSAVVQEQRGKDTDITDNAPLQIDALLHAKSPKLHHSIGEAAARVAEFLLRQTPFPNGFPHLQEYRQLFIEKYGEQAEVPLLDLLSPEKGLDAPAGYTNPRRTFQRVSNSQPATVGERDRILLNMIATAINMRSLEVELTEEIQQRLERWKPQLADTPLSLEVYFHLHATSREAIDRGEWSAIVGRNCGSPNGGRTFGRFFDLLGETGRKYLDKLARQEEVLQPDSIFAELSYQPFQARQANVAIRPSIRSYEIVVGTTPSVPPERVLLLNDLVVGVRHGRFYVRSLRLGKQVIVCQTHMLNVQLAPNVCRFLMEIATDGQPVLSAFDWGTLDSAPFLPRLTIKTGPSSRIVITPACWHLQAEAITPTGEGSDEARWFRGLQLWREQWRVPRYVYLTELDNRLLLDLENPLMARELYHELHKMDSQKRVQLDELLPDFEHLWLCDEQNAGYFSEIVVPLLRADAFGKVEQKEIPEKQRAPQQVITSAERSYFPGEEWVYLKLYAALSQHEELLAGPLHEIVDLLQKQELIDRWFFLRYVDPEPHLRLRFHAREGVDSTTILTLALPWSAQLARRGKIQRSTVDTYEREVERYGGPQTIDLLEQAFTADSIMISNLIASHYTRHLTLDPLAIAVFTLDHFFTSWGCNFTQRLEWTHQASEKYTFSKEFRPERTRYCALLSPSDERLDSKLAEQRILILEHIQPQCTSLCEIGTQVRQLDKEGKLWESETSLLSSLAHMHVNRLLGIDRPKESQVYAFWRHTLDALARRPGANNYDNIIK